MLNVLSKLKLNLSCRVIGVIVVVHAIVVPVMFGGLYVLVNDGYEHIFQEKVNANTLLLASEMRFLRKDQELLTVLQQENQRQPIVYADFSVRGQAYYFVNQAGTIVQTEAPAHNLVDPATVFLVQVPSRDPVGDAQGNLAVAYDLNPILAQRQQALSDVVLYVLIYLFLAVLLALYIRKTLVMPILQLKDAAQAVANGDLQTDLQVQSSLPEMQSLGSSLDFMRNVLVEQAASLKHEALHDRLTGLPNRGAINELIEREHARSVRKNDGYTLMLFDLDHFKQVNDNYGHNMGDEVLRQVAKITQMVMREADVVARWGGEEFLGLLPEMAGDGVMAIADRLRRTIEQTVIQFNQRSLSVTISMGLASFPLDGDDWHSLLEVADLRLYEAKRGGRNRVVSGRESSQGVLCLAEQIEMALKQDLVSTVFTPIVALKQRKMIAEQVAPQMTLDSGHQVSQEQFMLTASQLNMAHQIDAKVMQEALGRCIAAISQNKAVTHLVKVSGDFMRHPELFGELLAFAKERCRVCATGQIQVPLVIELEETSLMSDVQKVSETLKPFIDAGIRIALSGFGRGQNSVQYLAELPVSFLKIAPEMVKKAQYDWRAKAILQGLQATASQLQLKTVAESIDSKEMLAFLVEMGVDWGYGPLFRV